MDQLLLHLIGDYILQSHWMAVNKSKKSLPCLLHCLTYTLPFLLLTRSWLALGIIGGTHFLIDRFGLARYLIWLKNWQAPGGFVSWHACTLTGYYDPETGLEPNSTPDLSRPIWLRIMLFIVTDNTLHLLFNFLALRFT